MMLRGRSNRKHSKASFARCFAGRLSSDTPDLERMLSFITTVEATEGPPHITALLGIIGRLLKDEENRANPELINAYANLWKAVARPASRSVRKETRFPLIRSEIIVLLVWGIGTLLLVILGSLYKYASSDAIQLVLYCSSVFGILLGAKSVLALSLGKEAKD